MFRDREGRWGHRRATSLEEGLPPCQPWGLKDSSKGESLLLEWPHTASQGTSETPFCWRAPFINTRCKAPSSTGHPTPRMNAGHCPRAAATLWHLSDPLQLGEEGREWDLGVYRMSKSLSSESKVEVMPWFFVPKSLLVNKILSYYLDRVIQ